ncbi:MAG: hypothetical protein M1451_08645, partial [Acidobacteria bacterium]|nr:hypothetical protein [Acidobacteriota bacterium]
MSVMMAVNVALFLVLVLFGVSVFTPQRGAFRLPRKGTHSGKARHLVLLVLIGLAAFPTASAAQEPAPANPPPPARAEATPPVLTNAEILQMVKSGFAEETILKAIQLSETQFDTSVTALLEMKNAGVSEKVMQAMLHPKAAKAEEKPAAPAKNPLVPDDVGIYYIKNEALVEMR